MQAGTMFRCGKDPAFKVYKLSHQSKRAIARLRM